MWDAFEIWHSATAAAIVLWARREPLWRARFRPRTSRLVIAGALLPLLDYLVAAVFAPDSIEFITRARWMHSVPLGALLLAGAVLLAAFVEGFRRALTAVFALAAGWALHLSLDTLTPAGIWLGLPERPAPFDWPAFAHGHWPLLALLLIAFATVRARPAWARGTRGAAWALIAVYFAGGIAQFGVVSVRAAALARPERAWDVVPQGVWRARWLLVITDDAEHRIGELGAWGGVIAEPSPVARGNDEARLLALLADPVVRRFYFRVFRHPVTQVDESPIQLTLTMREASDLDAGEPGATFTFETDLDGRERVYHVDRFD